MGNARKSNAQQKDRLLKAEIWINDQLTEVVKLPTILRHGRMNFLGISATEQKTKSNDKSTESGGWLCSEYPGTDRVQ